MRFLARRFFTVFPFSMYVLCCGIFALCAQSRAAQLLVSAVTPESVGQGEVALSIAGGGFQAGAAVKLTRNGSPDVLAASSFIYLNTLEAIFDLTGADTGSYDL